MAIRIAVIQGHPDPTPKHFGHALAAAYVQGARQGGHDVRSLEIATLDFPIVRTPENWRDDPPSAEIRAAQEVFTWADHLVLLYPLWLGSMPALLKGYLEQVFRPGFAIREGAPGRPWKRLLTGKSARIVVTMGMPAFVYRWYFRAHSLKSLERNILGFSGIRPIKATLIGGIESLDDVARRMWLEKVEGLGRMAR